MKVLWISIAVSIALASCGPVESISSTAVLVEKGSILVIDEANQVLKAVNLSNGTVSQIAYVGNAANDIEIDGDNVYIAASLNHTLLKINLSNGITHALRFPGSPNPYNLRISDGRVYVTQLSSNMVSVVDKNTMALLTNIVLQTGGNPEGIIVTENIYVATSAGYASGYSNSHIEVYNTSTYAFVTNIPTAKNPQSLCNYGGTIFVAATGAYDGSGKVQQLNGNVASDLPGIASTQPAFLAYKNNKLFVIDSTYGSEKLIVADSSGNVITALLAGKNLKGISFDNSYAYLSEGYGGNSAYRCSLADYSITTYTNTGGGDCVYY